jgi:hypothetical protein
VAFELALGLIVGGALWLALVADEAVAFAGPLGHEVQALAATTATSRTAASATRVRPARIDRRVIVPAGTVKSKLH